jgi:thymidylate kinase
MRHPFIVFEGVDGAGKSEVSALVADKLGATCLESPQGKFLEIRRHVDDQLPDKGRLFFYMASNFDLSKIVQEKRVSNTVVCSRYIHSTFIGYASRHGVPVEDIYDSLLFSSDDFESPDVTIFLDVNEEAQRNRLESRPDLSSSRLDLLCLQDGFYRQRLFDTYRFVAKEEGWICIDTSSMPLGDVVETCIAKIKASITKAY